VPVQVIWWAEVSEGQYSYSVGLEGSGDAAPAEPFVILPCSRPVVCAHHCLQASLL
jgi:hypothetical protein